MADRTIVKVLKVSDDIIVVTTTGHAQGGYRINRSEDPKSVRKMNETGQNKAFFYAVPDAAVQGWRLRERAPW